MLVTLLGAVVTFVGGMIGDSLESSDIEDARNEARAMETLRRKDEQARIAATERMEKARLGLSREQLMFQKREAKESRKERAYDRGVTARDKQNATMMGLINSNQAMRGNFLNFFQRRTTGRRSA